MSLTQDLPPDVSAPNLAFLGGILDTLADPVFVKDRAYRFVMVNQAFCTFVGRTRAGSAAAIRTSSRRTRSPSTWRGTRRCSSRAART